MKKFLVLALALVFMFSGAVIAQDPEPVPTETTDSYHGTFVSPLDFDESEIWGEYYGSYDNHSEDDGEYTFTRSQQGDRYTILADLDRTGYEEDVNLDSEGSQKVAITLDVDAYIPCFLEMKITGNQGTAAAISYGRDTEAINDVSQFFIMFDNEIGGFLDADWNSLGHGGNAQINPVEGVYIGACDMFAVEVISNDKYRYSVESDALSPVDTGRSTKLPMHMRTSVDGGANWRTGYTNFNQEREVTVAERNAGVKLEALHNFRVPYDMRFPHGHYDGDITFRAITI